MKIFAQFRILGLTYFIQEIIPQTDIVNRQFLDLVRKLLAFDPAQRLTVAEAIKHPYFSLNIAEEIYVLFPILHNVEALPRYLHFLLPLPQCTTLLPHPRFIPSPPIILFQSQDTCNISDIMAIHRLWDVLQVGG
jgi:serine/threonine protein kinase